jgi:hypothetical protein
MMSLAFVGFILSRFTMHLSLRPLRAKATAACAVVGATTVLSATMASAALTPVDLELFLSVDVSGSVDSAEFSLQQQGYVQAFQNPAVHAAIASKQNGVAVALGQWSGAADSPLAVDWTLLTDAASSNAFAAAISAMPRQSNGATCVACGINAAVAELDGNIYDGARIIDVSGDGEDNVVGAVATGNARDAAAALGIKINGLPIITSDYPNLDTWYQTYVQTANGFTRPAADFDDFNTAVQGKIVREISGDGVPGPLPIFGAGLALGFSRRLRKRINLATLA